MIPWEPSSADIPIKSGVEETFRLTGTKTVPQAVNVGGVQPTYDMGAGGFARPTWGIASVTPAVSIAGAVGGSIILIGPTGFTFAGVLGNAGVTLNRQNARILASSCIITFDAAGAAAFNGKEVQISWDIRDTDNSPNFQAFSTRVTVATALLSYRRSLDSAFWTGIVPGNMACSISFASNDGTVFPANTTVALNGFVYVLRADGAQLPR